jgi:hypothetical protein
MDFCLPCFGFRELSGTVQDEGIELVVEEVAGLYFLYQVPYLLSWKGPYLLGTCKGIPYSHLYFSE